MRLFIYIIFFSFGLLVIKSCNNSSDEDFNYRLSAYPIDSVQIDYDTMLVTEYQTVYTFSTYDVICRRFYAYDFKNNGLQKEVYAWSSLPDYACESIPPTIDSVTKTSFNFVPTQKGTYTLKFWKGVDSQGNPTFVTKSIVVK